MHWTEIAENMPPNRRHVDQLFLRAWTKVLSDLLATRSCEHLANKRAQKDLFLPSPELDNSLKTKYLEFRE